MNLLFYHYMMTSLSHNNIATSAPLVTVSWNICFHISIFNLFVVLDVNSVSYKQYTGSIHVNIV